MAATGARMSAPETQPWVHQDLPENGSLEARVADFHLGRLLTMDQEHYENKVWPLCFYISRKDLAKWQMNAARALGNMGDTGYVPMLGTALAGNPHETVRGMAAWALGRLGGARARTILESRLAGEAEPVKREIEAALEMMR